MMRCTLCIVGVVGMHCIVGVSSEWEGLAGGFQRPPMPSQLTGRQKINYAPRLFQCAQLPSVWLQFMSPIRKNSIWPQQHQFHKSAIGHKPQKKTKPSSQCKYFIHNYFFFFCMSVFVFDEQPHNLWKPYDLMNFDGHV